MGKPLLIAAAAIVLLTVGAMLLVYRLTEPAGPERARAERAADRAAAAATVAEPPPPREPQAYPGSDEPGAAVILQAAPPTYEPVQNESPPIQGPTPLPLPEDPQARQEELMQVRKQRFGDQMERLNRRNLERAREAPPAPGPPPAEER